MSPLQLSLIAGMSKSRSIDHIQRSPLQSSQGKTFGLSFPHFTFLSADLLGNIWYLQITKPYFSSLVDAVCVDSEISITGNEELFLHWSLVIIWFAENALILFLQLKIRRKTRPKASWSSQALVHMKECFFQLSMKNRMGKILSSTYSSRISSWCFPSL